MRIVSTVPSQTELLYHLGLDKEVVGITKFCIHPADWYHSKQRIGGTKQLNIECIASLQPDWIIANKEENVKEQIEACQAFSQVYVSDVQDLTSAYEMILRIGEITNYETSANEIVSEIRTAFHQLSHQLARVAYLIWKDPIMTVGGDTFIHHIVDQVGWTNVFGAYNRYPTIRIEDLQNQSIDYLLLSSEPYPFSDKHIAAFQAALPNTKIMLVDGTYFSWYGSRLRDTPKYINGLLNHIL